MLKLGLNCRSNEWVGRVDTCKYDLMAVCCEGQTGEEWVIIATYGRRLERAWEYSFYFECDLKLLGKSFFVRSPALSVV
jgi:hypothetical protein